MGLAGGEQARKEGQGGKRAFPRLSSYSLIVEFRIKLTQDWVKEGVYISAGLAKILAVRVNFAFLVTQNILAF